MIVPLHVPRPRRRRLHAAGYADGLAGRGAARLEADYQSGYRAGRSRRLELERALRPT